jgi:hypothetical protein
MTILTKEQIVVSFLGVLICLTRILFGLIVGWIPQKRIFSLNPFAKRKYRSESPLSFWVDIILCAILGLFLAGAVTCSVYSPWEHSCLQIGSFFHLNATK